METRKNRKLFLLGAEELVLKKSEIPRLNSVPPRIASVEELVARVQTAKMERSDRDLGASDLKLGCSKIVFWNSSKTRLKKLRGSEVETQKNRDWFLDLTLKNSDVLR